MMKFFEIVLDNMKVQVPQIKFCYGYPWVPKGITRKNQWVFSGWVPREACNFG